MSVLFKLGGLGEALEGLVYGLQPDPARREQIPNFTEERLVLIIGFCRRRRSVEVFLEAGLKERVVADVPALAVPHRCVAPGIKKRDALAKKD